MSGSVKENLVFFHASGLGYHIDKNEDPVARRLCCQNKMRFKLCKLQLRVLCQYTLYPCLSVLVE